MQQPIYYPAPIPSTPYTYQKAADSIQLSASQGGHPQQPLSTIFSKPDRQGAYQSSAVDAIQAAIKAMGSQGTNAGAQMSFSGDLVENLHSLADAGLCGYADGWNATYASFAGSARTSGGFPRLDLVAFTYHHALLSLNDAAVISAEIELHKLQFPQVWGQRVPFSKGLFPAEMSFSERAIPALVEAGIEWVIVPNNHISRACASYPFSPHGDNTSPPNRADQVNPKQDVYFNMSVSRGCTPNNAAPFSYRPHWARHVNPQTGKESRIIVVPAAMALSWQDGYECMSSDPFDDLLAAAGTPDGGPPMLVVLAHDGDNAFGGGYSYYHQCVPQLVRESAAKGYEATTIQQYLSDYPPADDDVVHVEDGSWINKDGDFGSPQVYGWNWPLLSKNKTFDIPHGWALNERNWAIITAALNFAETARQVAGSAFRWAMVQQPTADASPAELAYHFLLPSTTSGYMYYGAVQDMPVKQTIACNISVDHAQAALGSSFTDTTPPSVWTPQRLPWNPGAHGMGALWDYKYVNCSRDFFIWTFAYDVSGIANATLFYRVDDDGVNPLADDANELYDPAAVGLTGVGAWNPVPMEQRAFPKGNVYNESIELYTLPEVIADEFSVELTGLKDVLIDYYVQAVDTVGNAKKTDIFHVYVD